LEHIILLNGTSSAGKTSTATQLQKVLEQPYLHVSLDTFLGMFPASWVATEPDFPGTGPLAQRLFSGFHHSLAALAGVGNPLIVDHVLVEPSWLKECVEVLAPFSVFFVGVRCPLEVLEQRERGRGDRLIGLARVQFERVHAHASYDLEVDTSLASPSECAAQIQQAVQQTGLPRAFEQLRSAFAQAGTTISS
jgi:chloramphenicol 3-O phosphotransferase